MWRRSRLVFPSLLLLVLPFHRIWAHFQAVGKGGRAHIWPGAMVLLQFTVYETF